MGGTLKFISLLIFVLSAFVGFIFLYMKNQMPEKMDDVHKFISILILVMLGFVGFVLLGIFGGNALLMTVTGAGVVFFAFKDYDWFMNSFKAVPLRIILGRDGTRVLYIIFGIAIFFIGLMSLGN